MPPRYSREEIETLSELEERDINVDAIMNEFDLYINKMCTAYDVTTKEVETLVKRHTFMKYWKPKEIKKIILY